MHDQIELYHIINSKPILSKNAHYQLKRHFPLHSVVFKVGISTIQVNVEEALGEAIPLQFQI